MATPTQPKLFIADAQVSSGRMELFPAVWQAAEEITSPSLVTRMQALEVLMESGAPRLSPLVAYLLVTRLTEPDLQLRVLVVRALGDVLRPDGAGYPAPDKVRSHLMAYCSRLRRADVLALLECAAHEDGLLAHISNLLNLAPFAGEHLGDILSDRQEPLNIRQQAAYFIGRVGYVDALPVLERLRNRIEVRQNGQKRMSFAPPSSDDEPALLPVIREAITLIQQV